MQGDTAVSCNENQELEEVSLVEKLDPPFLSLPVKERLKVPTACRPSDSGLSWRKVGRLTVPLQFPSSTGAKRHWGT